jgi:hypothetical protein
MPSLHHDGLQQWQFGFLGLVRWLRGPALGGSWARIILSEIEYCLRLAILQHGVLLLEQFKPQHLV